MAITYRQPGVPGIQTWAPGVAITFPPSDMARIENAIQATLIRLRDECRDRPWPGPYIDRSTLAHYGTVLAASGATETLLRRMIDDELWRANQRLKRMQYELKAELDRDPRGIDTQQDLPF